MEFKTLFEGHMIDVELINGDVLRDITVKVLFQNARDSDIISDFLSRSMFKYNDRWYQMSMVLSVTYKGRSGTYEM